MRILVFLNSVFQPLPHPYFYENCVKEHLKRNHPHMPYQQKEAWKKVYQEKMAAGGIVKVNNMTFKEHK